MRGETTPLSFFPCRRHAAFYDGPMLLTSLNVVKNFVLLGDVAHSVQFVRYKDEVGSARRTAGQSTRVST